MPSVFHRQQIARPPWPFRLNPDSAQAQGLAGWLVPEMQLGKTAKDLKNWRYDATVNGSASVVVADPVIGSAWSLPLTSGNYLNLAITDNTHPFDVANLRSLSVWVLANVFTAGNHIAHCATTSTPAHYWRMYTEGSGKITFTVNIGGVISTQRTTTAIVNSNNTWHHIAVEWNGTTINKIWGNGQAMSFEAGSPLDVGYGELSVGNRPGGDADSWNGRISDLRLYSIPLTDALAYAIYEPVTRFELFRPDSQRSFFGNLFTFTPPSGYGQGSGAGIGGKSDPWTINLKPPVGSFIDYRNPITQGLLSDWLIHEHAGTRITNLVGGGEDGVLTGANLLRDTWFLGGVLRQSSVDINSYAQFSASRYAFDRLDRFTIRTVLWFTDNTTTTGKVAWCGNDDAAASELGIAFVVNRNNPNDIRINFRVNNSPIGMVLNSAGGVTLTNGWNDIIITYDGSGSAAGFIGTYVNGIIIPLTIEVNSLSTASHSSTQPWRLGRAGTLSVLGSSAGFRYLRHSIWNRVLAAGEVLSLYTDPYQYVMAGFTREFRTPPVSGEGSETIYTRQQFSVP